MSSVYKTARGAMIDLNSLKLGNEKVIAIGNADVNVRGDIVKNGKIIKTREEVMQESYNIKGLGIAKESKIRQSSKDVEPDVILQKPTPQYSAPAPTPAATFTPAKIVEDVIEPVIVQTTTEEAPSTPEVINVEQPTLENKPRGGLADAINRNKDISDLTEKLELKRKKI